MTVITDGHETVHHFRFSDDEFSLLDMYVDQCDALGRCQWFQRGYPVSLTLNLDRGGISFSAQVPPEDAVAAVLHRIRPLILQNEPATFLRVANLVGARIEDPLLRGFIKRVRSVFMGDHSKSMMTLTATGADPADPNQPLTAILNDRTTFLDWLNSYEYHRDPQKRERVDSLTHMLTHDAARVIFLGMLTDVAMAIFSLGSLVCVLTGHESKITVQVPRPKAAEDL